MEYLWRTLWKWLILRELETFSYENETFNIFLKIIFFLHFKSFLKTLWKLNIAQEKGKTKMTNKKIKLPILKQYPHKIIKDWGRPSTRGALKYLITMWDLIYDGP